MTHLFADSRRIARAPLRLPSAIHIDTGRSTRRRQLARELAGNTAKLLACAACLLAWTACAVAWGW